MLESYFIRATDGETDEIQLHLAASFWDGSQLQDAVACGAAITDEMVIDTDTITLASVRPFEIHTLARVVRKDGSVDLFHYGTFDGWTRLTDDAYAYQTGGGNVQVKMLIVRDTFAV